MVRFQIPTVVDKLNDPNIEYVVRYSDPICCKFSLRGHANLNFSELPSPSAMLLSLMHLFHKIITLLFACRYS